MTANRRRMPRLMHATRLIQRIKRRRAVIGIVGLGYVGLPLMLRFAEVGFRVLGFDIDPAKVRQLNAGQSYIEHIAGARHPRGPQAAGSTRPRISPLARECDALIICVPTPLNDYREPDLSFVLDTTDSLVPASAARAGRLAGEHHLPRHHRRGLKPRIEAHRPRRSGDDVFLVFSPEREDPGNPKFGTRTIPKSCGGVTPACLEVGVALYGQVIDQVVPVSSTRAAEMTKLLENIHRAVNIGLVNEMKIVCRPHGHRHPRGHPRRGDQTVRLRAVLPRARAWAGTASRSTRST